MGTVSANMEKSKPILPPPIAFLELFVIILNGLSYNICFCSYFLFALGFGFSTSGRME